MNCRYQTYGRECAHRAMYLVAAPYGSFLPYCLAHMTRVIVTASANEYRERAPGQRNAVQVLPIDDRRRTAA